MMLSKETAMALRRGAKIYHNLIEFTDEAGEKHPATATVVTKAKAHPTEGWTMEVRRHYGTEAVGTITGIAPHLWRTTLEKSEEDSVVVPDVVARPEVKRIVVRKAGQTSEVSKAPPVEMVTVGRVRVPKAKVSMGTIEEGLENVRKIFI